MKNWKQNVFFGMVAIIALGFAIIGCDDGNGETGKKEFTVTFDLEGGNIDGVTASVEITVKSGEKIANLPNPKKADNTFGGWFAEKNGNGNEFVSTTEVTSNLTVFAKWIPNPVEQYETFSWIPDSGSAFGQTVSVTIYFTALLGVIPDWLVKDGVEGTLVSVIKSRGPRFQAPNLTLTVTPEGKGGFVIIDDKLEVSETYVIETGYETMRTDLSSTITNAWLAIDKSFLDPYKIG